MTNFFTNKEIVHQTSCVNTQQYILQQTKCFMSVRNI